MEEKIVHKFSRNYLKAIARYYKERKVYDSLHPDFKVRLESFVLSSARNIPWPTRINLYDMKWRAISFLYLKDDIKKLNLGINYDGWLKIFEQGFSNNDKWSELGKLFYNEKKA